VASLKDESFIRQCAFVCTMYYYVMCGHRGYGLRPFYCYA